MTYQKGAKSIMYKGVELVETDNVQIVPNNENRNEGREVNLEFLNSYNSFRNKV